jgi:hypothetical protein
LTVPGTLDLDWEQFIQTVKSEHHMWESHYKVQAMGIDTNLGKYHYEFTSPKGKVSMVRYKDVVWSSANPEDSEWVWEIYSSNNLFDDVERYNTWKEVRERIKKVLSPDLDW